MMTECATCGKWFEQQRVTAKFCSTNCRVRNHRWKDTTVTAPAESIYENLTTIYHAMAHKEFTLEAAIALDTIRRLCDLYLPAVTRWWRCGTCSASVMKFIPNEDDCSCGKHAHWFIVDTRT